MEFKVRIHLFNPKTSCNLHTEENINVNARLSENELRVWWSTGLYDIVTTAVIVESIEKNIHKTTFVNWNQTEVSILVNPIPYNVTVVFYDRCRENYTSNVFMVHPEDEHPVSEEVQHPLIPPSTPSQFLRKQVSLHVKCLCTIPI